MNNIVSMSNIFSGEKNNLPVFFKEGANLVNKDGKKLIYSKHAMYQWSDFSTLVVIRKFSFVGFFLLVGISWINRHNLSLLNIVAPTMVLLFLVGMFLPFFSGYIFRQVEPDVEDVPFSTYWYILNQFSLVLSERANNFRTLIGPFILTAISATFGFFTWEMSFEVSPIEVFIGVFGTIIFSILMLISFYNLFLYVKWTKIKDDISKDVLDSYRFPQIGETS